MLNAHYLLEKVPLWKVAAFYSIQVWGSYLFIQWIAAGDPKFKITFYNNSYEFNCIILCIVACLILLYLMCSRKDLFCFCNARTRYSTILVTETVLWGKCTLAPFSLCVSTWPMQLTRQLSLHFAWLAQFDENAIFRLSIFGVCNL